MTPTSVQAYRHELQQEVNKMHTLLKNKGWFWVATTQPNVRKFSLVNSSKSGEPKVDTYNIYRQFSNNSSRAKLLLMEAAGILEPDMYVREFRKQQPADKLVQKLPHMTEADTDILMTQWQQKGGASETATDTSAAAASDLNAQRALEHAQTIRELSDPFPPMSPILHYVPAAGQARSRVTAPSDPSADLHRINSAGSSPHDGQVSSHDFQTPDQPVQGRSRVLPTEPQMRTPATATPGQVRSRFPDASVPFSDWRLRLSMKNKEEGFVAAHKPMRADIYRIYKHHNDLLLWPGAYMAKQYRSFRQVDAALQRLLSVEDAQEAIQYWPGTPGTPVSPAMSQEQLTPEGSQLQHSLDSTPPSPPAASDHKQGRAHPGLDLTPGGDNESDAAMEAWRVYQIVAIEQQVPWYANANMPVPDAGMLVNMFPGYSTINFQPIYQDEQFYTFRVHGVQHPIKVLMPPNAPILPGDTRLGTKANWKKLFEWLYRLMRESHEFGSQSPSQPPLIHRKMFERAYDKLTANDLNSEYFQRLHDAVLFHMWTESFFTPLRDGRWLTPDGRPIPPPYAALHSTHQTDYSKGRIDLQGHDIDGEPTDPARPRNPVYHHPN